MRRTNRFMVFLPLAVSLIAACSGPADMDPPPEIAVLDKPGAAPYPLSEGESYVLEAFGMRGRSQLISFCAPSGASGLEANVYLLGDDGAWENIGGGQISMGEEDGTPGFGGLL